MLRDQTFGAFNLSSSNIDFISYLFRQFQTDLAKQVL